jgi:predicted outer membrane repeat protein
MENLTKSNRRTWPERLGLTIGLALLFTLALLWGFGRVSPARADPGDLCVDGASGQDIPTCGTTITPCQTISYTLNSRASDGDTILIATGTYTENLTITGITVTLRGGYTISGTLWLTGTGETVINGNDADRVFLIHDSNSVLENLTITGGQAPSAQCWGSGVWVTNGDVTIRSSTITGNTGDCGGAGIEVNHDWGPAHLTLESSTVSYNTGGEKGGLRVWGGNTSAEVRDVTFISNTAGDSGGGIAVVNNSSAVIVDTHLFSNTADHGGGGIEVDVSAQAQITSVVIEHNSADYGGGIAVRGGASAFISGTRVISNTANESGGGVGIWNNGPVVVMANTIISDNYGTGGGGLSMWEPGSTFTGTNLLIVDNRSGPGPAGIALSDSSGGQLMNVTVVGNDSATGFDGAEISGPASGFPIVNSIFWGNGTDGANLGGNNLNVSYSDVQGGFAGTGNINADPLFIGGGDYHLGVGSPCIDKGTSAGAPTHDIEGTPRDAVPDMGAYEWVGFRIFLPLTLRN